MQTCKVHQYTPLDARSAPPPAPPAALGVSRLPSPPLRAAAEWRPAGRLRPASARMRSRTPRCVRSTRGVAAAAKRRDGCVRTPPSGPNPCSLLGGAHELPRLALWRLARCSAVSAHCLQSLAACLHLARVGGAPQLPRHAAWAYVCKSPRALVRMHLAKPLKSTQKRRLGSVCHAGRVDHCPPRLTPPLASIPRSRRIRRGCLVASNQCRMQASTWRCGPRRCLEGGTLDQATRRARCLAGPAAAGGTCTHRRAGMPLCSADARLWACVYIFLAATT